MRLFGKSERVQNRGSDGRREGAKGARPATFWRQEHAIKEPSAIFQTVSEEVFSEVREESAKRYAIWPLRLVPMFATVVALINPRRS
jgi:hypothetical protein